MSKFRIQPRKRPATRRPARVRSAVSRRWSAFRDRPARVVTPRQRPVGEQESRRALLPALRRPRSSRQRELDLIATRAREIQGRAVRAGRRAGR